MDRLGVGFTIAGLLCFVAAVVWACCRFPLPGNEEATGTSRDDLEEPIVGGLGLHDAFVPREQTGPPPQTQTHLHPQGEDLELLVLDMLAQQPPDADRPGLSDPPHITQQPPSQQHSPGPNALPDLTIMALDKFMELKRSAGEDLDPSCSICLAEWRSQDQIGFMPNCMHGFHSQCIATWLSTKSVCPLCRAPAS